MNGYENYNINVLEIKKLREEVIRKKIEENPELVELIIENFSLSRIQEKYIAKSREYNENSYSKKKIKEEEIIFVSMLDSLYELNANSSSLKDVEPDVIENYIDYLTRNE